MIEFSKSDITKLFRPHEKSNGEDNGQVTIIGGSTLFHGAPILALKTASRIVDMVFFASPEKSVGMVVEQIKSKLGSFIWVPWDDVEAYVEKSDAVLIGPGFMRFGSEKTPDHERNFANHDEGKATREITERLLSKFSDKKWVIDAGSLQTMEADWIPKNAIITPNKKEFELLFKSGFSVDAASKMAKKFECVIVTKGPESYVTDYTQSIVIKGGNPGMTKGGTGDILAGLTVALLAKNDPILSACSACFIEKTAADELHKKVGTNYNADDLADFIPKYFNELIK